MTFASVLVFGNKTPQCTDICPITEDIALFPALSSYCKICRQCRTLIKNNAIWFSKQIDDIAKSTFYNSNIIQLYEMRKELDEILQTNIRCARQIEEKMQSSLHHMPAAHATSQLMLQANNDRGIYFGYE